MNKGIGIIFLTATFLALSLSSASALSTSMNETYLPGETMIIEVQGNILESIDMDEIIFKRGHITVPFDYGVEKLDDNYYIWAIAPTTEMNYTLLLKNVVTTIGGQIRQIDYMQNFSISGNLTDYAVKPGVIETDRDFEIEVMLYEDVDREIEVELFGNRNMTLEPGENTIKFSIRELNETGVYSIRVGRYILPAYLRLNETRARPSEVGPEMSSTPNIPTSPISAPDCVTARRATPRSRHLPSSAATSRREIAP